MIYKGKYFFVNSPWFTVFLRAYLYQRNIDNRKDIQRYSRKLLPCRARTVDDLEANAEGECRHSVEADSW
jgi:hypothetical protein